MKIKQVAVAVLTIFLLGSRPASAERCAVTDGPRYNLVSDTVTWSMKIESGHHCIRGVRFASVELESVTLIAPPKSGRAALQGWGFTYAADDDFRGEDLFVLGISGKIKKVHGSSTIRILVSVFGTESPKVPKPRRD
jgi:hypothetical protein